MKYLIASDIHGSRFWCEKLLEAFENEKADRMLLLGDLLYHGPRNPLPKDYDTKAVFAMLNNIKEKLLCVRGNCDSEVDQMVLEFPMMADYCVIPAGNKTVYATHGHIHNMTSHPPFCKGDILLHGHTHVPAWTPFGDENVYLNPGSVSLPKDDTPNGYMLLEDGVFTWKDFDGNVYHTLKA